MVLGLFSTPVGTGAALPITSSTVEPHMQELVSCLAEAQWLRIPRRRRLWLPQLTEAITRVHWLCLAPYGLFSTRGILLRGGYGTTILTRPHHAFFVYLRFLDWQVAVVRNLLLKVRVFVITSVIFGPTAPRGWSVLLHMFGREKW